MMQELKISPEELYFLFNECEGDMIDYDYIAMMKDVQLRETVIREEIIASLESKSAVEDVWGEVSVSDDVRSLLEPIWNGDFESQIMRYEIEDGVYTKQDQINVHRLDEEYRLVSRIDDDLQIISAGADELDAVIRSLMPDGYEKNPESTVLQGANPTGCIIFRNIYTSGESAAIEQFFLIENQICRMTGENTYQVVAAKAFWDIAQTAVKGE